MKQKKMKWICGLLSLTTALSLSGCQKKGNAVTQHTHTYTPETMAASCLEKGYTRYECECGDAYLEDGAAALGHSYESAVIAPTTEDQGYTLYTCTRCGDSYRDEFTEKLPEDLVFSGAVKDYLLPLESFSRERTHEPEFVMIHFTSAVVLSQNDPYNMDTIRSIFEDNEVSVHYIIDRDGTIRCYVPENLVAWHAGAGTWKDNPDYTNKLNDYAIGIELAAIGSKKDMKQYLSSAAYNSLDQSLIGFTDAQYHALKELVRDICQRHEIPMDREHLIGHQEYSPKKPDPGELFDWERLLSEE